MNSKEDCKTRHIHEHEHEEEENIKGKVITLVLKFLADEILQIVLH